jgi:hypothetical protein
VQCGDSYLQRGHQILLLPLDDWRSTYHRRYKAGDPHYHLYAWTPQDLGNLLVEADFTPQGVNVLTDAMPPIKLAKLIYRVPVLRITLGWLAGCLLNRR